MYKWIATYVEQRERAKAERDLLLEEAAFNALFRNEQSRIYNVKIGLNKEDLKKLSRFSTPVSEGVIGVPVEILNEFEAAHPKSVVTLSHIPTTNTKETASHASHFSLSSTSVIYTRIFDLSMVTWFVEKRLAMLKNEVKKSKYRESNNWLLKILSRL